MIRAAAFAVLVSVLCVAGAAGQAGGVAEPDGFRGEPYRAPVPETLEGAQVLDDAGAHALWLGGQAVFVDVLPKTERPANLPAGTLWRDKPHVSIKDAVWLPGTGYEALHPDVEMYLKQGLEAITGGDRDKPLVIFCLADCWMSWNAAKRAVSYGYRQVYWYPDGVDGWDFSGHPLETITKFEVDN
ncbi:PQQ-dependent catabolism-associated CXXCW motif protein [Polymorphum gilvum]|uniref:Rhodanese n=1 Tax=Polymorphum gilvum (strain LMG 25793 / CGMCC 1.9160 / SL003B-26A1) TaxID=991905 RepID=F2IXW7_POLGS|nr:PQQ-dependent catabolism-associated CXXCW motif protein [Polymorphum gilvum]ADZ69448.1 Rhodanese [Polymorphum gilvum SL003B-26A1]